MVRTKKIIYSIILTVSWSIQAEKSTLPTFPKTFLWGAAGAEFQDSGSHYAPGKKAVSNWSNWEKTSHTDGTPHIHNKAQSGSGNNHWTQTDRDIALMKELGLTSYRFSVDWSTIEPSEGFFDEDALNHYDDFCSKLVAAGIRPMITLHHFVHPLWFEKKGAFEKHVNIECFVKFSKLVFTRFIRYNPLWCTINEPGIYAMQGYVRGEFPPGKSHSYQLAGTVLCNLMLAHTAVYKVLKLLPGGNTAEIGLVHNMLSFVPYNSYNILEQATCAYFNAINTQPVSDFLRTGNFVYSIPGIAYVNIPGIFDPAQPVCDFIGLNYYSFPLVNIGSNPQQALGSSCYPGEKMTEMPYRMYEAGLRKSIEELAATGLPIYITENGVCDGKDTLRSQWIQKHLEVISQAITDDFDIRGYYYWTLIDNFEWAMGLEPKFGLYALDFERQNAEPYLREGSKKLQEIIAHNS